MGDTRSLPRETREKAVAKYLEGHSSTEVGKQFGVSYATVVRWVHEAGYTKVEMTRERLKGQLEKGEDKRKKMRKHAKRKLKQIETYCDHIKKLAKEVNDWLSEHNEGE